MCIEDAFTTEAASESAANSTNSTTSTDSNSTDNSTAAAGDRRRLSSGTEPGLNWENVAADATAKVSSALSDVLSSAGVECYSKVQVVALSSFEKPAKSSQ